MAACAADRGDVAWAMVVSMLVSRVFSMSRHATHYLECGPADGPMMIFLHGWPGIGLRLYKDEADKEIKAGGLAAVDKAALQKYFGKDLFVSQDEQEKERDHKKPTKAPTSRADIAVKNTFLPRLLAALAVAVPMATACAGTRQLNAVFINIGSHDFYDDAFYKSYSDGDIDDPAKVLACWEDLVQNGDQSASFDLIARKHRPDGLDPALGRQVWQGDAEATKKARMLMKRPFEYELGHFVRDGGFDGLYLFDTDGRSITMMSVGARGEQSRKVTLKIDNAHPSRMAADFSLALCRIGEPLTYKMGF